VSGELLKRTLVHVQTVVRSGPEAFRLLLPPL
jgi:hypothetical protein